MRILVVGGTRFFGIPMINALLAKGNDVTIATRGNAEVTFDAPVRQVIMDRTDSESVRKAVGGQRFDVIIDKIAYGSDDVRALLENVSCDRYIQMSTCSVYPKKHADIREDEFVTAEYTLEWEGRLSDYAKTKRNAERAALEFMDEESCTFVRYPVVLGENDYTGRLRFYLEHIKNGTPMYIDDMDMAMSFIHEREAGEFIAYLTEHPCSGAVNGCSKNAVKISEIVEYGEKKIGKTAVLSSDGDNAPYNGLTDTLSFNTEKAGKTGYVFSDLDSWLYKLIDLEIERMTGHGYDYILFDLDGTLTDSGPGIINGFAYAVTKMGGVVEDKNQYKRFVGPPLKDSFGRVLGYTGEDVQRAISFYREYYNGMGGNLENEVYPGIDDLLKRLKDAGKTLVVATSKNAHGTEVVLEHFGLKKYFDFVATANDTDRQSKEDVIRYALEHFGIKDTGNVVMVGDREYDCRAAKEMGIDSVGVLYGYGDEKELTDAGATYLAKTAGDLDEILL